MSIVSIARLLLPATFLWCTAAAAQVETSSEPIELAGQAVWIKGDVKAIMPHGTVRTLKRRSPIYASDTLVTDTDSSGELSFSDGSLLTLREATTLKLSSYHYQKGVTKPSEEKYGLKLVEGGFRTITGAVAKDRPDAYQVTTPVATIGISGTDYETRFCSPHLMTALHVCNTPGLELAFYKGRGYATNNAGTTYLNAANAAYVVIGTLNQRGMPEQQVPGHFSHNTIPTTLPPSNIWNGGGGGGGNVTPQSSVTIKSHC